MSGSLPSGILPDVRPEPIEARLREFFAREAAGEPIVAAYLFGSVARGTDRKGSDVDVAVLYEKSPAGLDRFALEGEIERFLRRPVQVVSLERAPADLVHRVLRDGKLLLDRDRSRRIAFEVRARNEYFDLEPIRRRYRRLGEPAP
jgi:predicted nucleotidyltransferase